MCFRIYMVAPVLVDDENNLYSVEVAFKADGTKFAVKAVYQVSKNDFLANSILKQTSKTNPDRPNEINENKVEIWGKVFYDKL